MIRGRAWIGWALLVAAGCASAPRDVPVASPPSPTTALTPSAPLEVHVIDVGQGDAIWIRCPDGEHQLLIDSGDTRYTGSSAAFKAYLAERQATTDPIEVVVATHPHADHIGNMRWVVETYEVSRFVDNGVEYGSKTYGALMKAIEAREVPRTSAQDVGRSFSIDFCPREDVGAEVLVPSGFVTETDETHDPVNNASLVVRVDCGDDSFLFMGDAHVEMEELLVDDPATQERLDCDFLKVGHHGSATSTSVEFLDEVSPSVAAISCGKKGVSTNEAYKHPRHAQVLSLLRRVAPRTAPGPQIEAFNTESRRWRKLSLRKQVYVTAAEGTLVFESAGSGIRRR